METTDSLIYFSNVSENTHKFVQKLDIPSSRIPLYKDDTLIACEPYVLIVPTYGDGSVKRSVPPQVKKFLNEKQNRELIRGVIGAGNLNFGQKYGRAAEVISRKCKVPLLYKFELLGTTEDIEKLNKGLEEFWKQH